MPRGLGRDTLVLTKEHGLVPIVSISGQDVTVLDGDDNWTRASVVSRGDQRVRRVRVVNHASNVYIAAADDHPWTVLGRDAPTRTDELKGDGKEVLEDSRGGTWVVAAVLNPFPQETYLPIAGTALSFIGERGILLRGS